MIFWLLTLDLNKFIIVAIVPTGLQTCAKMVQMHLSWGGGTPWMQPKSNVTFKLASLNVLKFLAAVFGFKALHYSGHCAAGLQTCAKVVQMNFSWGGGTPWMQPNNNITFKLASHYLFEFLDVSFVCR